MKTNYILIILFLAFVFGCKTENKKEITKTIETEEISLLDTLQLHLNHGKKWPVNPETQGGVKKMKSIIETFKTEANKDYKALGKKLSKQTSYIIKNCSMVGEPHDQLHVVLVPMLDEISVLKESNDDVISNQALTKLEALIQDYFNHFIL